jgi:predicted ATPase/DNA-binding SARP family transcriptional activator
MEFEILGPLQVTGDGCRVSLGGHRQRAVLARLLVDANRGVTTDALIDAVWDDSPPATAHKTLQSYVVGLRKALGAGAVRTEAGGYRLLVDDSRFDARRFESLVAEASSAKAGRDLTAASALYDKALDLWRGEVLADFIDEHFPGPERARLADLRLAALEEQLDCELGLGHHGELCGRLGDLAGQHPLRERFWALWMVALYRSGRQAEALRAFQQCRSLMVNDLGLEPSLELRRLEAAIVAGDPDLLGRPSATAGGVRPFGNLPRALTIFVGRAAQLSELGRLLGWARLVTLTGVGGGGKTRLAIEVAERAVSDHRCGVWFIDLAPVVDPGLVARTVAVTLGMPDQPGRSTTDVLVEGLNTEPDALLVFDNCEQVIEASAALAATLLQHCPTLRILATSRQRLDVAGEVLFAVPPLEIDTESVELFVDRARLARPGFSISEVNRSDIEAICRGLDGLPLAIELAASQVRLLEPSQIAARMADRFLMLARPHAETSRHRSLLATVEWSHELLTPSAQVAFRRLSVFNGSFDLDAAEAVCTGDGIAHDQVLVLVRELVDKSLVVREATASLTARYRVLETLRMYARDRLDQAGERAAVERAHAGHYVRLAETAMTDAPGPYTLAALRRLDEEMHNLRAALDFSRDRDHVLALRLGVALWPYWEAWNCAYDGVTHLEPSLASGLGAPPQLRAWALMAAADLAAADDDVPRAAAWADHAITLFRRLQDKRGEAYAQLALGALQRDRGNVARAGRLARLALNTSEKLNDPELVGRASELLRSTGTR